MQYSMRKRERERERERERVREREIFDHVTCTPMHQYVTGYTVKPVNKFIHIFGISDRRGTYFRGLYLLSGGGGYDKAESKFLQGRGPCNPVTTRFGHVSASIYILSGYRGTYFRGVCMYIPPGHRSLQQILKKNEGVLIYGLYGSLVYPLQVNFINTQTHTHTHTHTHARARAFAHTRVYMSMDNGVHASMRVCMFARWQFSFGYFSPHVILFLFALHFFPSCRSLFFLCFSSLLLVGYLYCFCCLLLHIRVATITKGHWWQLQH